MPADLQIQPRCRAAAVCGIAGRCRDAGEFVGWAKAHLRRAHHLSASRLYWWARCALPTLRDRGSIPRDDLALTLVNIRRVEQVAAAAPHQKFRTPRADCVVAPAPDRGFARLVFRQLRQLEDIAPHLPGGGDLVAVGAHAKWNVQ